MSEKMHLNLKEQQPVPVLAGRWDLTQGCHPHLSRSLPELAQLPAFPSAGQVEVILNRELPVVVDNFGHHTVVDAGFLSVVAPESSYGQRHDEYPLAPLYVRDLSGRLIHTGLMPLLAPPDVPLFPAGCQAVPEEAGRWIENIVFLTYRRLESSAQPGAMLAGEDDLQLRGLYAHPNAYPFKLRPDTFYADGWRVPQIARVFAKPSQPVEVEKVAQEFLQRWQNRPSGQGYEEFYDANDGDAWFAEMFEKGCTVIPTLEAYNGRYHISPNYIATEVDPGRAVAGLHEVVSRQASHLPENTILDVVEPGWVTSNSIYPAKVVVSDGSGWQKADFPEPFLPNLALPHPRVSPVWGDVWLPTHPEHFAEPALWDWDANGHFIQVKGPLWDPLHYVYASTQTLTRAHRRPLEKAPHLYELQESLKNQFHPAVVQTWFDCVNERTAQQRAENPEHPLFGSCIDQVPLMKPVASIGYHALPLGLEYELDPAHFPNRHPRHRVGGCPAILQTRIVGLAKVLVEEEKLAALNVVLSEGLRSGLAEAEAAPERDDFTILGDLQSSATAKTLPAWLPDLALSKLMINIKRLFASKAYRQALQQTAGQLDLPTLPNSLFQFREAALAWRRLRYRLFTKYPAIWQKAYVEGLDLATAEIQISTFDPALHGVVKHGRKNLLGVKAMPSPAAVGLSSLRGSASLTPRTKTQNGKLKNGPR